MKRIIDNEKRLDDITSFLNTFSSDLDKFEEIIKEYHLLNRYYGSKNWFNDKEDYEKGYYPELKAGVLSEDAVWNLDDDMGVCITRMDSIIKRIKS